MRVVSESERQPIVSNGVLGMLIFLLTGGMLFAGLISAFTIIKSQAIVWPPPDQPRLPLEETAVNTWDVTAEVDGNSMTAVPTTITFDPDGTLSGATSLSVSGWTPPGADPLAFNIDLGGADALVQYGSNISAEALAQDGNAIGFLRNFAISDDGTVTGHFSNGETKVMAQVATAVFNNPNGLIRQGNSNYAASVNSGEPLIGEAGTGNRGLLSAGSLEMSNVDLALEFTNLIIAQRGFQANSRIITASDELLQDLVNLKR